MITLSVSYLVTIVKHGYPPSFKGMERGFREIAAWGFHHIELEGIGPAHSEIMRKRAAALRQTLGDLGLRCHNFCAVDANLTHPDPRRRRAAMRTVHNACEAANLVGAETLHLASYPPHVRYPNGLPYQVGRKYRYTQTSAVQIPKDYSFDRDWKTLVGSCREIADLAATHGRIVLMEPRVGEMIASSDSMLRLLEHVGRPNLKANFDTAHFAKQREAIPIALEKLRGRYGNFHVADHDGQTLDHLPCGRGIIDWRGFLTGLKRHGYSGYLGIDTSRAATAKSDVLASADFLMRLGHELGLNLRK